jgi:hypothetical protein
MSETGAKTVPLAKFAADLRSLVSSAGRLGEPFRALLTHSADMTDECVVKCRDAGLEARIPLSVIPDRPTRGAGDAAEIAFMVSLAAIAVDITRHVTPSARPPLAGLARDVTGAQP